jgi:hypothetical protein
VDFQAIGCANDPTEGDCLKSETTFTGDASGQVATTNIGG